ncbi:alpha/beta fold hydrolase, partial [Gandjariella thermophila]|uniref:alpha/beta fold hydrolase n=1 Tax=Gandjariella thermophila TaxID=1931992 RepID=UPI0027D97240
MGVHGARQRVRRANRRLRRSVREQLVCETVRMVPRLLRHPVWRQVDPDQGGGQGVLLVPGFGLGDRSLTLTSTWLRARGYHPAAARIGLNVGCTMELVERIEARLAEHAEATGRRVIVLGQSRGGWLGRLAAVRRPDLVRGLVMLASPVLNPVGVRSNAVRLARLLAWLAGLGLPGVLDADCLSGDCSRATLRALAESLPPSVPALSVYSRLDGIVPWRLCLDPSARCVEVRSTHTGMGLDPDVYTAVQPTLAAWAATDPLAAGRTTRSNTPPYLLPVSLGAGRRVPTTQGCRVWLPCLRQRWPRGIGRPAS